MVMALGKLNEARRRGREDMARAMRSLGRHESEIQQALDRFDNRRNGERER